MELVKKARKPKHTNPLIQIIYSVPKAGKTTIVSGLEDHLIAELEPGGANYITARVQDINKINDFNEFLKLIKKSEDKVATYLIIDTVTKLDEWSELAGTYNYMVKPQGKKFNRDFSNGKATVITHLDKRFETVHEIPNGYGFRHSREVMMNWYDSLTELIALGKINYVILLAHVKDKFIESKNGDTVEHIEINLTGKVKSIFSSRVDAIGHLKREDDKCYITYGGDDKIVSGGRCPHLTGQILISEKVDGKIKTYWDKIYK